MKRFVLIAFLLASLTGKSQDSLSQKRIVSYIDSTNSPELVMVQEFEVNASVQQTWEAYTTMKGYESCAVPLAEIELKVGGTIKTNYNKEGAIGDSSTIVTHIINYVPYQLLTLQAEINENFPEFMKKEAKGFYNVIYFEAVDSNRTKVKSYGIGYKNTAKYLELMNYFMIANESTLRQLINYLEK